MQPCRYKYPLTHLPWVIARLYLALALHASGVGCEFASLSNAAHFPQIVSVISLQNNTHSARALSFRKSHSYVYSGNAVEISSSSVHVQGLSTHTRGNRGNANVASSTAFINRGQLQSPARGPVITFHGLHSMYSMVA